LFERPCDDGRAIVEALGASLDVLEGAPFHLFGHSFGGTLAGELLRANPDLPGVRSLIVSASVPPHLVGEYLAQADGTRLLRAIEAQTARRAPSPRALQPFLHRALEADLAALRSLSGGAGEPLRVPTVAFAGTSDRVVPFGAMRRWYEQAGSDFCLIAIPGGHFSYAERHASCFFNGVARWLEAVGPGSS
jgi:surfactin synthase thioesterase subunit